MKTPPRCPSCRHELTSRGPTFPFCSERCKLMDLGAWASGRYAIPSASTEPEALRELIRGQIGAEDTGETDLMISPPKKKG